MLPFGFCKSMSSYRLRHDSDGLPLIEDCRKHDFALYYISQEAQTILRALYFNINGMRDKYVAAWKQVSDRLAGNPYVIGYDPLNEPMFADLDISYFINKILPEGLLDLNLLQPLYTELFDKYQESDKEAAMWFEPA